MTSSASTSIVNTTLFVRGQGSSQGRAINAIVKAVDTALAATPTTKGSDIWKAYKQRGLDSASSRASLYLAIEGKENMDKTSTWQDVFKSMFTKMKTNVPIIDKLIQLDQLEDGSGFQLSFKNDWNLVGKASIDNTHNVNKLDSDKHKEQKENKNNENPFESLLESEDEIVEEFVDDIEDVDTSYSDDASAKVIVPSNQNNNNNAIIQDTLFKHQEIIRKACNNAESIIQRIKDKSKKEIDSTTTSNIAHVNRISNNHISTIDRMLKDSQSLLDKLSGHTTIAKDLDANFKQTHKLIIDKMEDASMQFDLKVCNLEQSAIEEITKERYNFFSQLHEKEALFTTKMTELQATIDATKSELESIKKIREETEQVLNNFRRSKEAVSPAKPMIDTHGANTNGVIPEPFPADTHVRYKNAIQEVIGIVIHDPNPPLWSNKYGSYMYDIMTIMGTVLKNCNGNFVTKYADKLHVKPTKAPRMSPTDLLNTFKGTKNGITFDILETNMDAQDTDNNHDMEVNDDDSNSEHLDFRMRNKDWNTTPTSFSTSSLKRIPRQNEFQYPIDSVPQQVNSYILTKYAKDWDDLILTGEDSIRDFYEKLKSRLNEANIYLLNYDDITLDSGVAAITNDNCINFDMAYKAMNNAIFHMIDRNKTSIFKTFTEPLTYLTSFRPNLDGFGFLFELISQSHPILKRVKVAQTSPLEPPQFRHFDTINAFINAYILWIQDESLQHRQYTDKDKIEHVLYSLDDRFQTAKDKITRQLELIFLDQLNPQPFPDSLKLTPQLAITITNMIPRTEHSVEALMNLNPEPRLHVSELQQSKGGKIFKTLVKNRQKEIKNESNNWSKWSDKIKFTPKPAGTLCPACGKPNHSVYDTGCSALGSFMMCQEFFKTQPKDKLDMVLKAYETYQEERRQSKLDRVKNDQHQLKLFKKEHSPKRFSKIKKTYARKFFEDYPEARHDKHFSYTDDDEPPAAETNYESDSDSSTSSSNHEE